MTEHPKAQGQNALKREAIRRLLIAHPDWSDRRIAAAVSIQIEMPPLPKEGKA